MIRVSSINFCNSIKSQKFEVGCDWKNANKKFSPRVRSSLPTGRHTRDLQECDSVKKMNIYQKWCLGRCWPFFSQTINIPLLSEAQRWEAIWDGERWNGSPSNCLSFIGQFLDNISINESYTANRSCPKLAKDWEIESDNTDTGSCHPDPLSH